jgi:DNA polymerase III delta subunit
MVAWQLHVQVIVKAAGGNRDATTIAKDAKINPYVVRKSASVASGIGGPRLKKLIHEAVILDTRLKSEALDADDAIQDYIFRLANSL